MAKNVLAVGLLGERREPTTEHADGGSREDREGRELILRPAYDFFAPDAPPSGACMSLSSTE